MKIIIFLFFFLSCAKISYIAEQGIGQISLEINDIDNEDFLNDPNQKEEHKEKVRIVEKAKSYFYQYYDLKPTPIYNEVKVLDQPAVTYLVIHSRVDKIKPISTSFPIVGSFPYLGFFNLESAKEFVNEKKEEGFQTYLRPVFAYSTLNHPLLPFHDNILSSFFFYDERSLTELIFHELVHTIIFVGDNVQFNENLAQFVSEQMALEYFNDSKEKQNQLKIRKQKNLKLNQAIVKESKNLQKLYDKANSNYLEIQSTFLNGPFRKNITKTCKELELVKCWPIEKNWNNARFAALGTYEAKRDRLAEIYKKSDLKLKDFVLKLIHLESQFDDSKESFLEFIERKI